MHGKAKESAEIDAEKEIIEISTVKAIGKDKNGNLSQERFETEIANTANKNNGAKVYENGDDFLVIFDSGRAYTVDKDGNITDVQTNYEMPKRKLAEELQDDSYGTEEKPYEINCIEDLLDLSFSVNGIEIVDGEITYTTSYNGFGNLNFILTRNLSFKSELSYEDATRTDYGDINGINGVESLKTELTTGTGWVSIGGYGNTKNDGGFSGKFDGNNKKINALYINNTTESRYCGLFGTFGTSGNNAVIKDLGAEGNIYCNAGAVGGIVGFIIYGTRIDVNNCYFSGNIENLNTSGCTGGIIGYINRTTYVEQCYCKGKIVGHNTSGGGTATGGIIGYTNSETYMSNSHNEATVSGESRVGGIVGNGGDIISNCYNIGAISGKSNVGGILGYTAMYIENCYNAGTITSTGTDAGGIAGTMYAGDGRKIYKCYNTETGKVIGTSGIGGILGRIYSSSNLTVEQCYNLADINGTTFTAGVVGSIGGKNAKILNCYNRGDVEGTSIAGIARTASTTYRNTAKIVACYNTGILTSTNKMGIVDNQLTYNSYYLSTCGATDTVATSVGESELKTLASTLDKAFIIDDEENIVTLSDSEVQNVWVDDTNNINSCYPIFDWQKE